MNITELSIRRPVTVAMAILSVILLGFVSLRELGVDLLPNISYPRLSVVTHFPGVAPEEIETLITNRLEAAVCRIPGIRRVESISKEGVSYMTLEFAWGTDLEFTMLYTREALDNARDLLPEGADKPTIVRYDPQSKPIMVLALSGETSLLELKGFAEELLKPRLEQIEGIGSAEITGGVEREIQVEVDPRLLSLYGLTIDDVALRLDSFNRNLQGGTIRKGTFKYAIRVVGEFESLKEIEEISLKTTKERGVIRLGDISRVKDSIKERQGMTRLDGSESIGLLVRKESGTNTVKVTGLVRRVLDQVRREYPNINIFVVSEQAGAIETAIGAVKDEIVQGAILVFLVVLVFLQEWKTPLIIEAVLFISIIGTFNLLYFGNITLNIMSLGGLALGVGMLDDCADVVSENIFRYRSLGKSLPEAALTGAKEVGGAVAATALTTVVVFLPIIYVHGIAGPLFKDSALTVTFSLMASLLVSLTLLPMLQSRSFGLGAFILRFLALPFKPLLRLVFRGFNAVYLPFVDRYRTWLVWSLDHKGQIAIGSLAFFALTFFLGALLPREQMPPVKTTSFNLRLKTPVDYSLEQTADVVSSLERHLKGLKSVKVTFSQTGIVSGMESLSPDVSLNSAEIYVEVETPAQLEPTLEALRRKLADFPDVAYAVVPEQSALSEFLAFSSSAVVLKVKGADLDRLRAIARDLAAELRGVRGLVDVSASIGEGKPEFRLKVKRDALARYANLSPRLIGDTLVNAVRGKVATQFNEREKKYDILVRLEESSRATIESLLNGQLPHQGTLIPLRDLVTCEISQGPQEIRRENQQREVLVTANLHQAKISQVVPAINERIARLHLPENYLIVYGGEKEEMSRSFRSLLLALALGVLLTYMIMAAQFESLVHPFLVMLTLPMGAAGAFVSLFLTGQSLNLMSIIGLVVLVGLVVDDATVEIDYINQLRRAGRALREAVVEGCRTRLRAILMASLDTVFGLIPMALALERGAELLKPLGIVVAGGLLFSTFLTLIQIPVIYEWVERRKELRKGRVEALH